MKEQEPLSRESLLIAIQSGVRPKWSFFWGHSPTKEGLINKSCFSQWWEGHPFEVQGIIYPTAEHFMMAEKARLFHDTEKCNEILKARNPAVAKKLGREVINFEEHTWLQHRWDIVVRGNFAKFGQHQELADFLIKTGDRILVEASPFDRVWGIGMSANDPDIEKPENWKGQNLLGFALMEVRALLRPTEI